MDLRVLGKSGLRVSPLGLGTTKFGRNEQVKYPEAFDLPADRDIEALFEVAREAGVNLIDTAPAYGTAEERIGKLLPDPDDWVIVTKAGEEFVDGQSHFDFSPEAIRASVDRSRKRLKRDRLDVVLLHCGNEDVAVLNDSAALDTLMGLKLEGAIGAIGASTKTVTGGLLAAAVCDVVMVTLYPGYRTEVPAIQAAQAVGKGVLIKKPLASGHHVDPAAALSSVVLEPGVTSVIVGSIDPDHLRQNCAAVSAAIVAAANPAAA
jgi:aryl-alcohol dehydrogenase-like predicted oxidoreductase